MLDAISTPSMITCHEQDPQARLLDEGARNLALALPARQVLDEGLTARVHDALEGIEALAAHIEVVAHVHEYTLLKQGLRGAKRAGKTRQIGEGRLRRRLLRGSRVGAETELDDESLEERKVGIALRFVRRRRQESV